VHKFVWRNWDLVPISRMAAILAVEPEKVTGIGSRMGLQPVRHELLEKYERRNQFAIIKRNWEYLPNHQIAALLRMSEEELNKFLHQDIAFLHIAGPKPECAPLGFRELTTNPSQAEIIARTLDSVIGADLRLPGEDPFAFIQELSLPHSGPGRSSEVQAGTDEIDLTTGWSLVLSGTAGTTLQNAARDFAAFIADMMNGRLRVLSGNTRGIPKRKIIELRMEGDKGALPETHHVEADGDRIRIRAAAESGLMRGLLFLEEVMQRRGGPFLPSNLRRTRRVALNPRIVFPYFARYGDVLEDPDFESYYPLGYLRRIAHMGVNGIWLSGVLRDLVPSSIFPEFGTASEHQLRRLKWLIERSAEAGLGVFLYLNEPRGMTEAFFKQYPAIKGEKGREGDGLFAMCTSTELVQRHLIESLGGLFKSIPRLGGVILITASENLTNCYSLRRAISCPRCRLRKPYEVVAEVVDVIARGVKKADPAAEVIVWDWSWPIVEDDPQEKLIKQLPANVSLMADFERGTKIKRGGVENIINEYCLSVPGPSERAAAHLRFAREKGLKPMAKIQLSTTWECGSMPFIPVLSLLGRKFQEMSRAGVKGAMQSWTLGSCPSVNTELASHFYWDIGADPATAMSDVAGQRYGEKAVPEVVKAWEIFSQAFQEYPFSNPVVYSSQVPYGPTHPLYFFPTHRPPSLQNTRDSLSWTAPFGPDIVAGQFEKMASHWEEGLAVFQAALQQVDGIRLAPATKDLGVARAILLHFKSVSNQIRFLLHREKLGQEIDPGSKRRELQQMLAIATRELDLAAQLYRIVKTDSRIGFEAFFQYIYRPHDILEKVVSCRHIIDRLVPEMVGGI
jgi:hypothetical protein